MKNIVLVPLINFDLIDEKKIKENKIEICEINKINKNEINKYDNIFIYEKNPYISNFIILKDYLIKIKNKNKINIKELFKAFKININYYNNIPTILNELKIEEEKIIIIENYKDIINNI